MGLTKESFEDWHDRLSALSGQKDPAGDYWVAGYVSLMMEISDRCADLNVRGNARLCMAEASDFRKAIQAAKRERHFRSLCRWEASLSESLAMHINSPKWADGMDATRA